VIAKFGIKPSSIPDYLAVVGDTADGYPGIVGWGPKQQRRFSRDVHIWKTFRKTGISGIRRCGERVPLLRRFSLAGTMHYCFALSLHFESMSRCLGQLTSCGGEGLPRISSAPVSASRRLNCSGVPRRRRTLSEKGKRTSRAV